MPSMRDNYESIKVINHTECDCVYKDQAVHRTTRVPYWPLPTSTKPPSCKCPTFFTAEVDDEGVCGCVCKNEPECKQRHEGREGFTMSDRKFVKIFLMWIRIQLILIHRCIQDNECVQPLCLHGTYIDHQGRCPDKNEKIDKGFQTTRTRRSSR